MRPNIPTSSTVEFDQLHESLVELNLVQSEQSRARRDTTQLSAMAAKDEANIQQLHKVICGLQSHNPTGDLMEIDTPLLSCSTDQETCVLSEVLRRNGYNEAEANRLAHEAQRDAQFRSTRYPPDDAAIFDRWSEIQDRKFPLLILAIRQYLETAPTASSTEIMERAERLSTLHRDDISVDYDTYRYFALKDDLNSWVNWSKTSHLAQNPYHILQAVFNHYGKTPPTVRIDRDQLANEIPMYLLDAAALLHREVKIHSAPQDESADHMGTLSAHREVYLAALMTAMKRQRAIDLTGC